MIELKSNSPGYDSSVTWTFNGTEYYDSIQNISLTDTGIFELLFEGIGRRGTCNRSYEIKVNPLPQPGLEVLSADTQCAYNLDVLLKNTSTSQNGISYFSIGDNEGNLRQWECHKIPDTLTWNFLNLNTIRRLEYRIHIEDDLGCKNNLTMDSAFIYSPKAVNVFFNKSPNCDKVDSAILRVTSNINQGYLEYFHLDFGDGTTIYGDRDTNFNLFPDRNGSRWFNHKYQDSSPHKVTYTVKWEYSPCVETYSATIGYGSKPKLERSVNIDTLNCGTLVQVKYKVSLDSRTSDSISHQNWNNIYLPTLQGAGDIHYQDEDSIAILMSRDAYFGYKANTKNGCQAEDAFKIEVPDFPLQPEFYPAGGLKILGIEKDSTIHLRNLSWNTANGRLKMDWGDGSIETFPPQTDTFSHTYSSTGRYTPILYLYDSLDGATASCSNSYPKSTDCSVIIESHDPIVIETGNVITEQISFKAYPVPASTELHLEIPFAGIKHITLRDAQGRTAHHVTSTSNELSLDIRGLPAGIYFLMVETERGTVVKRVIISP
ncbi:T9SS type A sorting domain-containing protein [bacterium]|nr:T9SS type A sorting domain-containing protein [bacterium]